MAKMSRGFVYALLGLSTAGAILAGGATPSNAQTYTVTDGGPSFTVLWDIPVSGHPDLMATAEFSSFDFSANTLTFSLEVTNTTLNSPGVPYTNANLTSFGWDTNPNATQVTDTSTVYASTINANITSAHVDVCFFGGQNCSGGGSGGGGGVGGLDIGESEAFSVTLTFASALTSAVFDNFFAKFQTNFGSFEAPAVPGPIVAAGLPGLVMACGGLLALARRRRQLAA